MNIFTNLKLIKRNTRIAQLASLSGLVVLIGGMAVSFLKPNEPAMVNVSFAALILGFLLSQVGIYFTNRWGRKPRPDELLSQALKGLDSKYSLYHFYTPTAHLLVGPAGIWVLMPRHQRGTITYSKGRWRQRGGGALQVYMRIFAQEGLGRPDLEIPSEIDSIQSYLHKRLPDMELPPIQAALVFTNEKVAIEINDDETPSAPTLMLGKLKETLRKAAKNKGVSLEKITEIQQALHFEEAEN